MINYYNLCASFYFNKNFFLSKSDEMNNEIINVKEFLQKFLEITPDTVCVKDKKIDELIKSDMKLSDLEMNRLKDACK